ncbi:MAG: pyridoxamine 5'-phosphate oxidase family protein [Pseudomonadales bacterium]
MIGWERFEQISPDIAKKVLRLLEVNEVAFLATVSKTGHPRIHPFVPRIIDGRFVAFIMDSSPKTEDLRNRRQYSVHTLPGREDEECFLSGEAKCCNDEAMFRGAVAVAMGFTTGVDQHHILYEFFFDRALWTRWLDFGTPRHRAERIRWIL